MVTPAPERFDPARLAASAKQQQGQRFRAEIPLHRFPRVVQLLYGNAGTDPAAVDDTAATVALEGAHSEGEGVASENGQITHRLMVAEFEFSHVLLELAPPAAADEAGDTGVKQTGAKNKNRAPRATKLPRLQGRLNATLQLQCQRCLGGCEHAIEADVDVVFVASEAVAERLPDDAEPVVLDDQGEITLTQLFEDELLLNMPSVARHDSIEHCVETEVPLDPLIQPDATTRQGGDNEANGTADISGLTDDAAIPAISIDSETGERRQHPFANLKDQLKRAPKK